ncbi:MAG TPA: hypothetical protein DCY13_10350 [Verrucomicrobiales bacterium]|nr:hypothetical protein [Verrucomicrobiales bacterium]
MFSPVDTRNPTAVEAEVASHYREMFPSGNASFVREVFKWILDCFEGRYAEFQAIDARYHDLEHTMQGTLCMVRMLAGRHRSFVTPRINQRLFELGLLGILLHDTGYLKVKGDNDGTGAKYTLVHVNRSCEFAARLLGERQFSGEEIASVQQMIRCTGVNVDLAQIPFQGELTRIVGFCLGSADLLGQMAAADYVDKLPILYSEFEESARYNSGKMASVGMFATAEELISKTPGFWEHYVFPKIERDFHAVYRFLNHPWPDGPNWYLLRIAKNLERIKQAA